ncbi:regulator of G-protein signaling 3-like isoform X1, partial [Tachysurus ichikawai]
PLDLCSPERTLLLSEEMILHDSTNIALKVTVFIYTDLMLLTREDESSRCNVLQSPLYLHQIQLQDGMSTYLGLLHNEGYFFAFRYSAK